VTAEAAEPGSLNCRIPRSFLPKQGKPQTGKLQEVSESGKKIQHYVRTGQALEGKGVLHLLATAFRGTRKLRQDGLGGARPGIVKRFVRGYHELGNRQKELALAWRRCLLWPTGELPSRRLLSFASLADSTAETTPIYLVLQPKTTIQDPQCLIKPCQPCVCLKSGFFLLSRLFCIIPVLVGN
jgi:hypothetical protein